MRNLTRSKSNAGLTLIEMLVVIIILGILSSTVVFAVGGMTSQSAVASCQTDGATVLAAVDAFAAQNPSATLTTDALLGTSFGGIYLSALPSNGTHYVFKINSGVLDIYVNASTTPRAFTSLSQCSSVK